MFLKGLMLVKQAHEKSDICHYLYFLNFNFKFQQNVSSRCHDLLMIVNLSG